MSIRKMFHLSALIMVVLVAQSMAGISAQEQGTEDDLKRFPAQVSVAYPMSTHGQDSKDYHYTFSFNIFSGKVGAVTGIEFGSFFNKVEREVRGVQVSGLFNTARSTSGIQFAGLGNATKNIMGVQVAGIGNITDQVHGVQFGGIASLSEKTVGVQTSGIANITKEVNGLQFAGIVNMSENITGIQVSGIANIVSEKSSGFQFAGVANVTAQSQGLQVAGIANISEKTSGTQAALFNRTKVLRGFQVGLVNVTDTIEKGVSLALINIIKNGYYEWELSFSDYANVLFTYKMGMRSFYTVVSVGGNFIEDPLWVVGLGVGNRTSLTTKIDFQPELVSYFYMPQDFKKKSGVDFGSTLTRLKLGFVYNINSKIGITIAPSIYHHHLSEGQDHKISSIKPFYTHEYSSGNKTELGLGLSLGMVLHL